MSFSTPGDLPKHHDLITSHSSTVNLENSFSKFSASSFSNLRKRKKKRLSDYTYDSDFLNSSVEALTSHKTPSPIASVPVEPISILSQEQTDLKDKQVDIDTSIPMDIFAKPPPKSPPAPKPQPPKKQESSKPDGKNAQKSPTTPAKPPAKKRQPSKGKKFPNPRAPKPPNHTDFHMKPSTDLAWAPPGLMWVTPFISSQITLPKSFSVFLEGIPWGTSHTNFTLSKQFVWTAEMSSDSILDAFSSKAILPHTIIWLPFVPDLLDFALKRLFRISFTNYASILIVCPFLDCSKFLPTFLNNPKHGTILLSHPVDFCNFQCILIFLNFSNAPHISVSNQINGSFSLDNSLFESFTPIHSQSLIANCPTNTNSDFIPVIEHNLKTAYDLEQQRLDSRFQCPSFPTVKVNQFIRKPFDFDPSSVAFHFLPAPCIEKFFPKTLFPTPKKKLMISYSQYNIMCEDDSKITEGGIPTQDLFCSICGKTGHDSKYCWMRIRSSKSLGLTTRQDKALNTFLLQLERAPSFTRKHPSVSIVNFVTNLQSEIETRANFFSTGWKNFARVSKVSADLVEPGFSQLRQGLPFWYAIACPIYVLQWIAFGIPVFWQCSARPPTFEVKPSTKNDKSEDSSEATMKAVRKFLAMSFLLPIPRNYIHCCAPLFDRESSGKVRSIHDLRLVNRFIMAISFTLFTAFNFCNLAADGSAFIITDFSSCWHQLRHLIKDMRFFAFRTVENGHFKYWLPLGKTFGESDVPFAITHIVSFITSLFNLFTLCAFWIDDGIIQVGNINNENWVETASCIRSFTAFLFSALCLLVNQKCDFQPSIEKPWVGFWNSAEGTFIQARKLEKFGHIVNTILSKGTISLSQAETLQGKINSFGLGLDVAFEIKLLNSFLKSVIQILAPLRCKAPNIPLSDNFGPWILQLFDLFLQSMIPKQIQENFSDLPLVNIAVDASNIGRGLTITQNSTKIFETAMPLPAALAFHSALSELESSSTDNERFAFESLALRTAKLFLDNHFPNQKLFLKIFTDSLPLAIQLTTGKIKSFRAIYDAQSIFSFLEFWGMPFTISYHSREHILGKLADSCTRYFIPSLCLPAERKFLQLTDYQRFFPLDVSEALLNSQSYFDLRLNVIIPLNLPTSLYSKLFALFSKLYRSRFLFCPKLKQYQSLFSNNFVLKFEFKASDFKDHDFAFQNLPYYLFEWQACPTQRNDAPKSLENTDKFFLSAENRVRKLQSHLPELLTPFRVTDVTSRACMGEKPLVDDYF